MPNWCNNTAIIEGPDQEIRNLWSEMTCGGEPRPMNCRPIPEDVEDVITWSRDNWGTKWEMDVTDFFTEDGHITLTGMTAWTPCLSLWEHISRLYPGVTITTTYYEEGMDFVGAAIYKAGKGVIEDGSLQEDFDCEGDWDDESYVQKWYDHVDSQVERYMLDAQVEYSIMMEFTS